MIFFLKKNLDFSSPHYGVSEIPYPYTQGDEGSSAGESYIDCGRLAEIRAKSPSSRTDREQAIMAMEYSDRARASSRPPADKRDWF